MQSSAITWEKYAQNVRRRRRIKIVQRTYEASVVKKMPNICMRKGLKAKQGDYVDKICATKGLGYYSKNQVII